jgi:hypothetical protein
MSKSKKEYHNKYNHDIQDDEVTKERRSNHYQHRMDLRKERALKTKNVEAFQQLENADEGEDEDYVSFYSQEDDEDWRQYLK